MIIFMIAGIFGSFVVIAMVIAMLKCCVESLADSEDNEGKLGTINTYQSRYGNTDKQNTYDVDGLTEMWTTNDSDGIDTRWNNFNNEDVGTGNKYECGPAIGVENESNHEAVGDLESDGCYSTIREENNSSCGIECDSKLGGSVQESTFKGESKPVFGESGHSSTFYGGGHSNFGGEHSLKFDGGHDTGFGKGNDTESGTGSDCYSNSWRTSDDLCYGDG